MDQHSGMPAQVNQKKNKNFQQQIILGNAGANNA